jgi:hypothetical protein
LGGFHNDIKIESELCDTQVVGRYGTQRVSARDNEPSSRIGAATWLDPGTGLLYLFGGHCIDKELQISMHSREWGPLSVLRRRCESEAHLAYIVREATGVLVDCWVWAAVPALQASAHFLQTLGQ